MAKPASPRVAWPFIAALAALIATVFFMLPRGPLVPWPTPSRTPSVSRTITWPAPSTASPTERWRTEITPTRAPNPSPRPTTDAASVALDAAYGTFDELRAAGSGDAIVRLPEDVSNGVVAFQHDGTRLVQLQSRDAGGGFLESLVSRAGEPYRGTTAFGVLSPGRTRALAITASGPWRMTIRPMSSAARATLPASGRGDAVLVYAGGVRRVTASHRGESNFIVWAARGDERSLLANVVANGQQTSRLGVSPAVVSVKADGAWNLAPA